VTWSEAEREQERERYQRRYGYVTDEIVEKSLAYRAYGKALRDGTLVRPDRCERCGKPPGIRYEHHLPWWRGIIPSVPKPAVLAGHHHHGYEKEHALDVVFLCAPCHGTAHAEMRGRAALEAEERRHQVVNELRLHLDDILTAAIHRYVPAIVAVRCTAQQVADVIGRVVRARIDDHDVRLVPFGPLLERIEAAIVAAGQIPGDPVSLRTYDLSRCQES
jgi:hypothetical protein